MEGLAAAWGTRVQNAEASGKTLTFARGVLYGPIISQGPARWHHGTVASISETLSPVSSRTPLFFRYGIIGAQRDLSVGLPRGPLVAKGVQDRSSFFVPPAVPVLPSAMTKTLVCVRAAGCDWVGK
jgi:hypothetical protein